jgi:ubiquinone/menaquinone biosynthesis methyltransferase
MCVVRDVFEKVASKYDLMNDVMTAGIHRLWKDQFAAHTRPANGVKVLDVAGGTGDIAFRLISNANKRAVYDYSVTVLDINEKMLEVGKQRATQRGLIRGLDWKVGDAEQLSFPDNTFDVYTIAFGIRNCTHIDKVLSEAHRVLKPGGKFLCLELSPGAFQDAPFLKSFYEKYSFEIVPILGQLFAADRQSYQYLVESIRRFPDQKQFSEMITTANFERVCYENLFNGVAAIHFAWKSI